MENKRYLENIKEKKDHKEDKLNEVSVFVLNNLICKHIFCIDRFGFEKISLKFR